MAVDMVGIQSADHLNRIFQLTNHEFAVSSFTPSASISATRTGHARFRRGPIDPQSTASTSSSSPPTVAKTTDSFSKSVSTSSSLASSNLAGEASVSNGNLLSSSGLVAPVPAFSAKKPPLPTSHRKRTASSLSLQGSAGDRCLSRGCHCCKTRKLCVRRHVKRIPILGSKVTSIPADDYSWKKYAEKFANGSRYPRVYYKCNSVRGCPARKRVEVALDDTKMLIVTYDGEHRHGHAHAPSPMPVPLPIPVSLAGVTV